MLTNSFLPPWRQPWVKRSPWYGAAGFTSSLEVAKLVERGRLKLPMPTGQWLHAALAYPGVKLLELSPDIAADACCLPGEFHSDPADQIIVATARNHGSELVAMDRRILSYPHVPLARMD